MDQQRRMLTRPVIKEANLFNMSMLALLVVINKRRPQECCVCFSTAPGCFHLVCIFSVFFFCLVIQHSFPFFPLLLEKTLLIINLVIRVIIINYESSLVALRVSLLPQAKTHYGVAGNH